MPKPAIFTLYTLAFNLYVAPRKQSAYTVNAIIYRSLNNHLETFVQYIMSA